MERYYKSSAGRREAIRVSIEPGRYRLYFEPNDPAPPAQPPAIRAEKTLGLLCAGRYPDLVWGVEEVARKAGFRIVVASSRWNLATEAEQIRNLSESCAGLIVAPIFDSDANDARDLTAPFRALSRKGFPHVFVERRVSDSSAPLISPDNEAGGRLATEFLVSKCECKTVIVVPNGASVSDRERISGHTIYMQEHFGPDYKALIAEPEFDLAQLIWDTDAGQTLLASATRGEFVGVITMSEQMAQTVHDLTRDVRKALEERVLVIGFSATNSQRSNQYPGYTLVTTDYSQIGAHAAEVLLQMINDRPRYGNRRAADLSKKIPSALQYTHPESALFRKYKVMSAAVLQKLAVDVLK